MAGINEGGSENFYLHSIIENLKALGLGDIAPTMADRQFSGPKQVWDQRDAQQYNLDRRNQQLMELMSPRDRWAAQWGDFMGLPEDLRRNILEAFAQPGVFTRGPGESMEVTRNGKPAERNTRMARHQPGRGPLGTAGSRGSTLKSLEDNLMENLFRYPKRYK